MMIWAPLFVFLLQISKVGGTNQYHLGVMLRTLHNNWSSVLQECLRWGVGGLYAKAKIILVIPSNFDLS